MNFYFIGTHFKYCNGEIELFEYLIEKLSSTPQRKDKLMKYMYTNEWSNSLHIKSLKIRNERDSINDNNLKQLYEYYLLPFDLNKKINIEQSFISALTSLTKKNFYRYSHLIDKHIGSSMLSQLNEKDKEIAKRDIEIAKRDEKIRNLEKQILGENNEKMKV